MGFVVSGLMMGGFSGGLAVLPGMVSGMPGLFAAFMAAGFVSGLWLPFAAGTLQRNPRRNDRASALLLEICDSAGGACGGLLAALTFLPLCGVAGTLFLLAILALMLTLWSASTSWHAWGRAVMLPLLLSPFLCFGAPEKASTHPFLRGNRLEEAVAVHGDRKLVYERVVDESGKLKGYIFNSAGLVSGISGYKGPIDLRVICDPDGVLVDFRVVKSQETREYLDKVMSRKQELLGKNIFAAAAAFKGDAVTGATFSADAIKNTLNAAGAAFSAWLKNAPPPETPAVDTAKPKPPPGSVRKIDAGLYQRLIREGRLSNREAMYQRGDGSDDR